METSFVNDKCLFNIMRLLGISSQLNKVSSDLEIYDFLRRGLPNAVLSSVIKRSGFSLREFAIALGVSQQTLKRLCARESRSRRLSAIQSIAVWKVATVFSRAQHVMGSAENAKIWLCSNARALRYRKPVEFIALGPGIDLVSIILYQLDRGVYL